MNFSLKLCGHFWPWIEFCKLINIFVYITEHWNLFYGKPAAKIEGFFKTCRVRISTSELKIAKLYSKNCEAQMLKNVSPSPLQFHCERSIKNLYYTSKHDKTFLGRARKHTTQLFDQKMLGDINYLLIANIIVTLFNTRIDIWARQNDLNLKQHEGLYNTLNEMNSMTSFANITNSVFPWRRCCWTTRTVLLFIKK